LAFALGGWLPQGRALAGVAVLSASMQIAMGFTDFPNLEIGFATLIPLLAGIELRKRRELNRSLTDRNHQLESEEERFVALSVRHERASIARELHDIVAHHLAVMVVQAGAGRMAPDPSGDGAPARFAAIRQAGENALSEMALLVDVLQVDRDAGAPGLGRLKALIEQAEAGGLDVRLTPLAPGIAMPREVQEAAVRVIQEGLTNAIKHAPGAEVHVRLTARDDRLDVMVLDDGAPATSALATTGAGLGLTGMRERIEALGGTLVAGARPGRGWSLQASLPRDPRSLAVLTSSASTRADLG
jgi:signal transduction histidine kinase